MVIYDLPQYSNKRTSFCVIGKCVNNDLTYCGIGKSKRSVTQGAVICV